jgi:hypothetical protein
VSKGIWVWDSICWSDLGITGGFASTLVSILGSFVANEAQDSAHNVRNHKFLGLRFHKSTTNAGNIVNQAVNVEPFRSGDDLE